MNPTVLAAAIGVGGTVIVGVTGFWASVRNTSKTVLLARESRIWDKRAEVYADAISALQSLLGVLYGFGPLFSVRDYRIMTRQDLEDLGGELDALETRLQAWASDSVLTEIKAHPEALNIVFSEVNPDPPSHPPRAAIADSREVAISDLRKLIELMRTELQGRRSGPPGRWWRRRWLKRRAQDSGT
jgi:hypothetical protein